MTVQELPVGVVLAAIAVAAVIAIFVCVLILARSPFERRAGFARFLGKAFIVLIGITMLIAAIQQWGR